MSMQNRESYANLLAKKIVLAYNACVIGENDNCKKLCFSTMR